MNPLNGGFGFSGAPFRIERFVEYLELLYRLGGLAGLRELVGQHQANVVLSRAQVSELLERLESVAVATTAMHPVGVLEEVLLGVAVEALFCRDLTELVVDLMAGRCVAQDLVAKGDGVVQIAAIRVEIHRLLVVVDGLICLVET